MTDQTIPADKVRPILDEWERIKEYADWEDMDNLVQDVRALLPTPPLPTLADMSEEERRECQWMQADVEGYGTRCVIASLYDDDSDTGLVSADGGIVWAPLGHVTPRPDLPRMAWPGTEKTMPAPALPDGWRFADHQKHGRGIVTNPTPNRDGRVCFVLPADDPMGYDWIFCTPEELTYLPQ